MKNNYFVFLCLLFLCIAKVIQAQSIVNGTVLYEEGFSINNVLVYNLNTQKSTYTDSEGKFILVGKFNDELRFIKDGYKRISVIIRNNSSLIVTLVKKPYEIDEVRLISLTGNLQRDSKRIKDDNSIENLKKEIGLPEPKGKQREKIPTVVNDVLLPLLSLSPTIKIQELYTLISGDNRRMKALYKYEDIQDNVKWIRDRIDDDYFTQINIPQERISEFLKFAIETDSNIILGLESNNIEKVRFDLESSISTFTSRLNEIKSLQK